MSRPVKRIISLVPSQTELLADLGLDEEVVGITKFCIHPAGWRARKTIIGGTKQFDFDAIAALQSDLIIGNKEENYEAGIRQLEQLYPVWMSDIATLDDARQMMLLLGIIVGRASEAKALVDATNAEFTRLRAFQPARVLYLIWRKPWMAVGPETFIHEMLLRAGWHNAVPTPRYPELSEEALQDLQPDYVFLSSEPYPFREKHITELQKILPRAKVLLVDGEMFSWYGSRLRLAPAYLNNLTLP